mmetsp:Transcript_3164/g.2895  ORF Transcript_3164/g.2895 Transcript_3164/m.2895 type:complete len:145 (-) Transcript_3164:85-519(-)
MESEDDKELRIREAFRMIDRDGNNIIELKEVEAFIFNQGMNIQQEELQEFMEKIDTDRDGNIQYGEFEKSMKEYYEEGAEERMLKQVFDSIDRDHDGCIRSNELKYALYCLGEEIPDADIENMIQFATNGNDFVTFSEFVKMSK